MATPTNNTDMNGNSLIAALAGDATTIGGAFIAEQGAVAASKSIANGINGKYMVYGLVAVAGFALIYFVTRKK